MKTIVEIPRAELRFKLTEREVEARVCTIADAMGDCCVIGRHGRRFVHARHATAETAELFMLLMKEAGMKAYPETLR